MSAPFFEHLLHHPLVGAFGLTLLHSLWQGVLAAALAGIVIMSTRRSAARVRYWWIGGIMLLFLCGTALTLCLQLAANSPGQAAVSVADAAPSAIHVARPGLVAAVADWSNAYAGWIVALWTLVFLFKLIQTGSGLWQIKRLRTREIQLPDTEWRNRFYDLKHDMGIRKVVKLLESRLVKVPVTIGTLKPIVLVPLGLLGNLPAEQLETILLHELAHIRRNDYLINLVQHITETIFFFNPGLLWISALLKEEREACCDEMVLDQTRGEDAYMKALVSFQEFTLTQNSYAMSLKDHPGQLFARIQRMITGENGPLGGKGKLLLLGGALALAALCVFSNMRPATASTVSTDIPPVVIAAAVMDTVPAKKYVPFAKPKNQTKAKKPAPTKSRNTDSSFTFQAFDSASFHKFEAPQIKFDSLDVRYEFHPDKKLTAMNVQVKDMDVHVKANHNLQVHVQPVKPLDVQVKPLKDLNVQVQPVKPLDVQVKKLYVQEKPLNVQVKKLDIQEKKLDPQEKQLRKQEKVINKQVKVVNKEGKVIRKQEKSAKPEKPSKNKADDTKSQGPVRTQAYQSWYPPKPIDPDDRC